jgi:hypothetical protein
MNVKISKIEKWWYNIINNDTNQILIEGRTSQKICVEQCRDKNWNLIK